MTMNRTAKEIIVIGGNHHNTLAVLRSLGEKGIQSLLIVITSESKPYVGYSKFIQDTRVIKSENDITSALYSIHQSVEKAVVIACSDSASCYLDQNRDALSKDFILPGAKEQGRITHLMNKNIMMQLAIECGLSAPRSWVINSTSPNVDSVSFPCIVKPLASIIGSKQDIAICKSKDELNDYLRDCNCKEFQIQEYISKSIEFQLIGCSLNGGEQVIIPGATNILRQERNTNTGFLRYIPIRNFTCDLESCVNFVRRTGYSGLFSLEFIRDNSGKDFFLEINFRNDGNSICVTAAGMNLPYIWYLYNYGFPIEPELCYESVKEVIVMPEFSDISNPIHKRIKWSQWLKDIKRTDCFMDFSKNDQMPFWIYIFKRIFKRS